MAFEPKTAADHRDQLVADFVTQTGISNLRENSVLLQILAALGVKLEEADFAIHQLRDLHNMDLLQAEDLDEYAQAVLPDGMIRKSATVATSKQIFIRTVTDGELSIPLGTAVARDTPTGRLTYATTVAGVIEDGETTSDAISISAAVPGAASSSPQQTIDILVSNVDEITSTYNSVPASGQDSENDEEFRVRIRSFVRSLPRCTASALEGLMRQITLSGGRRITSAWAVVDPTAPGVGAIYIDDGYGTVEEHETVPFGTLISTAVGSERLIYTRKPWKTAPAIYIDGAVQADGVDYTTVSAWGQIRLTSVLTAGQTLTHGSYTVYTGLVAEAQRQVDGDPADRVNVPGYRAAWAIVSVLPATVKWQTVGAFLVTKDGYDDEETESLVAEATINYINSLNVGEPLYWTRLIGVMMAVPGALKVTVTTPAEDTHVLDNEVLRTDSDKVSIV